mgnify:CR=1 FL=1
MGALAVSLTAEEVKELEAALPADKVRQIQQILSNQLNQSNKSSNY